MRVTFLLALAFLAIPAYADVASVSTPSGFGAFNVVSCCSSGLQLGAAQTGYVMNIDGVNVFCGDDVFCEIDLSTGPLLSVNGNVWTFAGGSVRGRSGDTGMPQYESSYPLSSPGCAGDTLSYCLGPDVSFTGNLSGPVTVTVTGFGGSELAISGAVDFSISANVAAFGGFSPDYSGELSASIFGNPSLFADPQDGFSFEGGHLGSIGISGLSVPEPGSLWLLAGIVCVGLLRIVRARRSRSVNAPLSRA